jgi:prepilin-type processing-associated H-X9-DG protein
MVIGILAILIALLLPAVQGVRETARLIHCRNNLKQLAIGLLHHESSQGVFPPALTYEGSEDAYSRNVRPNWVMRLLPHVEQLPLHDSLVPTALISDLPNRSVRGTRLPVMLCPTDSFNGTDYDGGYYNSSGPWARGNYAANGGRGYLLTPANFPERLDAMMGPESPGWKDKRYRGVMGANVAAPIASIRDGTSTTILVGEVRAGLSASDARGTWALPGSPSSLWAYGSGYDSNGPNYCGDMSDDFVSCGAVVDEVGLDRMRRECMTCAMQGNWQQTVRSLHRGGVNIAFCDGSARFISDWIDTSASFGSVWDRLILSASGLTLDWSQVEH